MTADSRLICSHDIELEKTTTPRSSTRMIGHGRMGNSTDFTLDETGCFATGRLGTGSPSGDAPWSGHGVPTFEEAAELVLRLNASTGRNVGLMPEIKDPKAHLRAGLDPSAALLGSLRKLGLDTPDSPVWIQCFDHDELRRIRHELGHKGKLVALTGSKPPTDEELAEIATFADAIGPSRRAIENDDGTPIERPTLVERAHAAGLAVFPYTFKAEIEETRRFFRKHRVDGLFTDFPNLGVDARD